MTPEQLATLHARAFTETRPWSAEEFKTLLENPHCFIASDSLNTGFSFALGRVVADEAELLTLATDPDLLRQGHARACLAQFEGIATKRAATKAFIEVAADNLAALSLYQSAGYQINARRGAYYNRKLGPAVDALVLIRNLAQ